MAKRYIRLNWQNRPSVATPVNAANLNAMDKGIDDCDNAIEDLYSVKLNTANIANNDVTTAAGLAWDARRGKAIRDDLNALNNNLGSVIEGLAPAAVTFTANILRNIVTISIPAGKYYIFAQMGSLAPTDLVSVGVSIPNVVLLKQNKFSNSVGLLYTATATTTLLLHATIKLTAGVALDSQSDYIQAVRLK